MNVYLDLWLIATGAAAGAGALLLARGRNRLVAGAAIGALIALVMGFLRAFV